jgi:hypothetical protein
MRRRNLLNVLDVVLVLLVLIDNSVVSYFVTKYVLVLTFIIAICHFLISGQSFRAILKNNSIQYLYVYIFFIVANLLRFPMDFGRSIGLILLVISSFLIVSTMGIKRFSTIYTNILALIILVNIPIYISYRNGLIEDTIVLIPNLNFAEFRLIGIFNVGWDVPFVRMSGIWHEPGAFQIFISMGIIFLLTRIKTNSMTKLDWTKFIIFIVGFLFTESTMAYIVLMIVLVLTSRIIMNKLNAYAKLLAFLCSIFAVFILASSDVVQNKFAKHNDSKEIRTKDNVGNLIMIAKYPMLGVGLESNYAVEAKKHGVITSSNGILFNTACLGILWLIAFLAFTYVQIKKMTRKSTALTWGIYLIVLLCLSNEAYMFSLISNVMTFKYLKYD